MDRTELKESIDALTKALKDPVGTNKSKAATQSALFDDVADGFVKAFDAQDAENARLQGEIDALKDALPPIGESPANR